MSDGRHASGQEPDDQGDGNQGNQGRHAPEGDSRVERPTGTGGGGIDPARY
jgi:hypothetical protein